eukprot:ctg_2478.g445
MTTAEWEAAGVWYRVETLCDGRSGEAGESRWNDAQRRLAADGWAVALVTARSGQSPSSPEVAMALACIDRDRETVAAALHNPVSACGSQHSGCSAFRSRVHQNGGECQWQLRTFAVVFAVHDERLELRVRNAPGSAVYPELRVDVPSLGHWYGTGHTMQQHWPSSSACLELGPFYPFDNGVCGLGTLAIAGWCTSGGWALWVDEQRTPYLHVAMNAPRLYDDDARVKRPPTRRAWSVGHENAHRGTLPLLDARWATAATDDDDPNDTRALRARPVSVVTEALPVGDDMLRIQSRLAFDYEPVWHPLLHTRLAYAESTVVHMGLGVGTPPDARGARERLLDGMLGAAAPPSASPPLWLLQRPIWTTWAKYKAEVTQAQVLAFAEEIVARGLPRSVLEIDDRWCSAYGDWRFDADKFPRPQQMVKRLHALGFRVTLWCTAFVERQSGAYAEGCRRGYLVNDGALFPWWQPQPVAALDVTDAAACVWFVGRARALQRQCGIDGFKFDSGEPCWLPRQAPTLLQLRYPGEYTELWLNRVVWPLMQPLDATTTAAAADDAVLPAESRAATSTADTAAGHRASPSVPCLWRLFDRFSYFGYDSGLASVVPAMLISGVLGVSFVLPDMIGGNEYGEQRADDALMLHWLYANALMPSLQFSLRPWDFAPPVEAAMYRALAIRDHLLIASGLLKQLAEESCRTRAPMARPLWWVCPQLPPAHSVADAFLMGDDLLVAPQTTIPDKDAVDRVVWLPPGDWWQYPSEAIPDDTASAAAVGTLRPVRQCLGPVAVHCRSVLPVFIRCGSALARWALREEAGAMCAVRMPPVSSADSG